MLISVFITTLLIIYWIDKRTNKLVYNYIDTESERISNNIISNVIHRELANYDYNLLQVKYDNGDIIYNTSEINKLTNKISNSI